GSSSALAFEPGSVSTTVEALGFDSKDPILFIADSDGNIRRWDFTTGEIDFLRRRSQILADYARENVMLVSPDSVGILHADGSGRVRNIARISLEKTDGFGTRAGQSYWRSAFQIGPKPVFAISQYGRMGA